MTELRRHRRRSWLAAAAALAVLLLVPASVVSADEFPKGYEGYHTYSEVWSDIAALANAHPDIAKRFSIGDSYQGRHLWALKISDNVDVDEAEPEVLYDGGTHADEHMGVEMALRIAHWFVNGYGTDTRITNLVEGRARPSSAFLDHTRATLGPNHTAYGNRSRFVTGEITIRGDERWREEMRTKDKLLATLPALPLLTAFGYPVLPPAAAQPASERQPADPPTAEAGAPGPAPRRPGQGR